MASLELVSIPLARFRTVYTNTPRVPQTHANDDRSPLTDLLTCIGCNHSMEIELIAPDNDGENLIRYRCKIYYRIEILRLSRRGAD